MADNDEVTDLLKKILSKVEDLEKGKSQNMTINSGTINIDSDSKCQIEIKEVRHINIKADDDVSTISVEISKGDVEGVSISADKVSSVMIKADGDITGNIVTKEEG